MADDEAASGSDPGSSSDGEERMDLPKWNRARVKRKAPAGEEQDAFQGSMRRAGRGAARRAPMLVLGLVGLAALIGGGVYWWSASRESAAEATRILAEAAAYQSRARVGDVVTLYGEGDRPPPVPVVADDAERVAKIRKALEDLASNAPGTAADRAGDLIRGAAAIREGKLDDAEKVYRGFLEAAPDHELAFLASEGLGIALEGKGDLEGALSVFQGLSGAKGTFYRDQALAHAGRVLEALGRKDEALALYRTYLEEYPLTEPSLAREFVRDRMLELDPEAVPDTSTEVDGMPPQMLAPGGGS